MDYDYFKKKNYRNMEEPQLKREESTCEICNEPIYKLDPFGIPYKRCFNCKRY